MEYDANVSVEESQHGKTHLVARHVLFGFQVLGDAVEVLFFWFLFEETLLLTNLAVSGMVE